MDEPGDIDDLRTTAAYQFGRGAGRALFPENEPLEVERSRSGRPRQVIAEDGRIASLTTVGLFSLGIEGGRRLHSDHGDAYWVRVGEESEPYVRDGRNAFAKFVTGVDPDVRRGDEVRVLRGDTLIGVGRAELSSEAMLDFETGMAVSVREGADQGAK